MYRLLIVDDEIHAVNGIKSGIDWNRLGIAEVFTAYNIRQAKEIFATHSIDLMICDIEMPQGNGLELLAWVNVYYNSTKSIFLTCHADFQYAQEAIRLRSLDYLLKPVVFSELEEIIGKAISVIEREKEALASGEISKHYYALWSMHKPLLIERFWLNLLNGHIPAEIEAVKQYLAKADILYLDSMRFIPVLIKIQRWHDKMMLREEKLKEHELWNHALEKLLTADKLSQVLQLRRGLFAVILATDDNNQVDKEPLRNKYQEFLDFCNRSLGCDLSCTIGSAVSVNQVPEGYAALLEFDRNFVAVNKILFIDEHIIMQKPANSTLMSTWQELFIKGKRAKWQSEVVKVFASLNILESFDAKLLREYYHDFMQMIYSVLKQIDIPAYLVFTLDELQNEDRDSYSSVAALQEWVNHVGERVFDFIQREEKNRSITDKIKLYISQNIGHDLTRETIAKEFFLNPDYLTRIFKKETGCSILEYLVHERIKIAQDLLIQTDLPIREIVSRIGYTNFSYFSKIFKKMMGLNPLLFRKRNHIN